ncbi:hypothetical protein KIN20_009461 [Parelaphostrongylus tenuis]|uniref:Uncharacterized protein n=1 Tax=Parelaphostrongylus tenuis TaxID=148309 RepID=A0AAD5QJM7_PARTN|nr:hypothetical protein KIN20_009461 [Parelaphostrongylus tenuis]
MTQNCRVSCQTCGVQNEKRCYKDGKLILPVVSKELVLSIRDTIDSEVLERIELAKRSIQINRARIEVSH